MKGRYFPDTDFMHATVPSAASTTWRAIIAGRDALSVGLIHRVGDGSTINAWTDKWIPSTNTMSPMFRPAATTINHVSDLIDMDTWTWRGDLVRENFIVRDAEAILNIPLRRGGGEDFLAWAFEKSGIYTVKSSYRALMIQKERAAQEEGQATDTLVDQKHSWNALWSLKVVSKVRVFWWRVIRGILPDESTLRYRHIRQSSLCKLCQAEEEKSGACTYTLLPCKAVLGRSTGYSGHQTPKTPPLNLDKGHFM